eukprot:6177574-Pleurochrysis_carterae.AAC.1
MAWRGPGRAWAAAPAAWRACSRRGASARQSRAQAEVGSSAARSCTRARAGWTRSTPVNRVQKAL